VKLKDIVRSVQQDLPITMRMDDWLTQPNPLYSDKAKTLASAVFNQELGGNRRRKQPFRSSSMGMCKRRRLFAGAGFAEHGAIDAKLGNIFGTGNFLHLKWQMAGLTEGWLSEAEIALDKPSVRFGGTLDGKLFDGSGFEFKTIHSAGFAQVMAYGPKALHVLQVHSYMLLDESITAFSIVYEDKGTSEWREFRVQRDDQTISVVNEELEILNRHWEQKSLPKMLPDCETKEGSTYRNCPFREICPKMRRLDDTPGA
jgi:hypothetical protein